MNDQTGYNMGLSCILCANKIDKFLFQKLTIKSVEFKNRHVLTLTVGPLNIQKLKNVYFQTHFGSFSGAVNQKFPQKY